MAQADIGSKRLISLAPDAWVKWVTNLPNAVSREILGSEFQLVSRENDVLLKASNGQGLDFLLLTEIQMRPDPRMPKRIRAYAGLAEEKYNLLVYPVVVNILPPEPPRKIRSRYESDLMNIKARQDYRVINLWEVDVAEAFKPQGIALLPLAPVMKGGDSESVLRRAVEAVEELPASEQPEDLKRILGIFATFVLGTNLVERIMSLESEALRESPWGKQFLQEGVQQGVQQGMLRTLQRLLRERFGELPSSVESDLAQLSAKQLEELVGVAIKVSSLEEFIAAVPAMAL